MEPDDHFSRHDRRDKALRKVTELDPLSSTKHYGLAQTLGMLRRFEEAIPVYDRAIEISPESGGAWFARGRYWDARGNTEAANSDFLRANELGYSDPWLLRRIREISG